MKKLVASIGLAALGAVACGSEEEASLKAFWAFQPTDGCLTGEEIWFDFTPDPFGEPDRFDCQNGEASGRQEGVIGAVPLGNYTVTAGVYVNDLLTLPEIGVPISFNVDGQVKEETFTFARGFANYDVSFGVDFGTAGGGDNCAGTGKGGLAVNSMSIDVVDYANPSMCVAVTVTEDDSTADAEDSCSPSLSVCFSQTITFTINDLLPGRYLFQVRGYKALSMTVPCWEQDFDVQTAQYTAQAVDIGDLVVPYYMGANRTECETVRQEPLPDELPGLAQN